MSELKIKVEVAYALPEKQKILQLDVVPGTTVSEAVKLSGITNVFPEIDLENSKLGIFGKAVTNPEVQEIREGDRVEIYRPLKIDPKQARLNRAKKKA
ncbi:RnfH family protein [Hahella sp. CCB-MM4]|uniref:RnfH family protein n=1 Tax=Hahella sp. (strain CCB-MM4) TaxID=1926491 RepID=UPI001AEF427E|nr:RnfH family protein [Hahella sp. CCB-MM4]